MVSSMNGEDLHRYVDDVRSKGRNTEADSTIRGDLDTVRLAIGRLIEDLRSTNETKKTKAHLFLISVQEDCPGPDYDIWKKWWATEQEKYKPLDKAAHKDG